MNARPEAAPERGAHRPGGAPPAWTVAALLFLAAFAAYGPALHGGFVWDDDFHVTRPELRSLAGLARIWFTPGATAQYYPVLHSAFWLEHRLWGDLPFGYHVANVLLHGTAAGLLILLLRRLAIPGAVLAGFLFALHPVAVESVAWVSEQKNTLSTVLYLLSALAYLRFDRERRARWYVLALGGFLAAMLSKSVTASLPAALLVVFWWQRGRLSWRRDVLPLAPWLILALAGGLFTAWVEHAYIGAQGAQFAFTPLQRVLVAGRAIWFYLGKLLWPANLIFIYPRWRVDPAVPWQDLLPLAAIGMFVALAALRRRSRAPLAAWLCFTGTLFPALGFVNVYPFLFSFVADHFQYLASLAILALAAAGWARWRSRAAPAAAAAVLGLLGVLTWRQCRAYRDAATLYRTTLERNPACWMADTNLGTLLVEQGRPQDALIYFQRALALKPDSPEAHVDRGDALRVLHRDAEARQDYEEALRLRPAYPDGHYNLGVVLAASGQLPAAIAEYREAIRLAPAHVRAHNNLANALRQGGRVAEAVAEGERARALAPDSAEVRNTLGVAYGAAGRVPAAIAEIQEAVRLRPAYPEAQNNLANMLAAAGDRAGAAAHYEEALRLAPDFAAAHFNLAQLLAAAGDMPAAIRHLEAALRSQPNYPEAENSLGNALRATGRDEAALVHYARALELRPAYPQAHYNRALLLHALGREREALEELHLSRVPPAAGH
jgi:tetratricopeptide (TPR) repeat protein